MMKPKENVQVSLLGWKLGKGRKKNIHYHSRFSSSMVEKLSASIISKIDHIYNLFPYNVIIISLFIICQSVSSIIY